jgi:2-keto-4-pentenoate hydratase
MRGVEAGIAFKIVEDIAPRPTLLAEREIFSAIESVHAVIEIVDTRLSNWREADRMWVLADMQSNGGLVFEPGGVPWRDDDFCDVAVELVINGRPMASGRGGNPAGDLRRLLVWIVNHCALFGGGLAAGTIITTGSYTGMIFVDP